MSVNDDASVMGPLPFLCPLCGCSVPLATHHMGVDIYTAKPYWTCEKGSHLNCTHDQGVCRASGSAQIVDPSANAPSQHP